MKTWTKAEVITLKENCRDLSPEAIREPLKRPPGSMKKKLWCLRLIVRTRAPGPVAAEEWMPERIKCSRPHTRKLVADAIVSAKNQRRMQQGGHGNAR